MQEPFLESSRAELLKLLAEKAYRFGEFSLSSGLKSNHYVNCKPISLSGSGLVLLSKALLAKVDADADAVAGLTLGADPLVSGVSMMAALSGRKLDALIVRKEAKGHGTGQWLEGPLPSSGSLITVLEDVVTSGGSALKAVKQLRAQGYVVNKILTIVDRQEGGAKSMNDQGIELISLFEIDEIINKFRTLY